MKQSKSVTVGITTCYAKSQLLEAVKSVRGSTGIENFRLIIVADRTPLNSALKKALKTYDVELIENDYPSSAFSKQKQILDMTTDDIIIITQDDVLIDKDAFTKIVSTFKQHREITFIGLKNEPLQPKTLIEASINIGTRLMNEIAGNWNSGDNYLAIIGRLMAFRTQWLKSEISKSKDPVSLDAYFYLENKRKGGKYKCLWDTNLYFRNPQNLTEHLRKSSRFQHSKIEMKDIGFFGNLDNEYKIPIIPILRASFKEFVNHPIAFIGYVGIFIYTRLAKIKPEKCLDVNWEVDLSTKIIN